MRLALIASLVVNVFLAATLLTGTVFKPEPPHKPDHHEARRGGGGGDEHEDMLIALHHFKGLDEDQRGRLFEALGARKTEAFSIWGEAEAVRRQGEELLGADEFDAAAFRATAARLQQLNDDGQDLFYDITVDYITALPDEDRLKLAEEMKQRRLAREERFRRWQERREQRGDGPGDGPKGPPPDGRRPEGPPPGEPPADR